MTSLFAVVITVTQILMKLLEGPLAEVAGKYKLLLVTFLSLVMTVVTGLSTGVDLFSSLLSGAGLAALQVFAHQFYVQFFPKA